VNVTVENRTMRDIEDVLQVYIKACDSPWAPPNPVLCAFKRIRVKAGSKETTAMDISARSFTVVDDSGLRIVPDTRWTLTAGFSQPDQRSFALTGRSPLKMTIQGGDSEKIYTF
jgi:beta-glucosidase